MCEIDIDKIKVDVQFDQVVDPQFERGCMAVMLLEAFVEDVEHKTRLIVRDPLNADKMLDAQSRLAYRHLMWLQEEGHMLYHVQHGEKIPVRVTRRRGRPRSKHLTA